MRLSEQIKEQFWLLLLAALIFIPASCLAGQKFKLAHGEYGITEAPGKPENVGKAFDEWTLWEQDGHLLVDAELPRFVRSKIQSTVQQEFAFTKKFRLTGYSLDAEAADVKLDCDLGTHSVSCVSGSERGSSPVGSGAYTFIVDEFYLIDAAWLYASIIHRDTRQEFVTPVYATDASAPDSKIQIKPDVPQRVRYLGEEQIRVLGRTVKADKYDVPGLKSVVWTSAKTGMVLAFTLNG